MIPADLLVLANAFSWPLDASHKCHKWLCEAAPWSCWYSQGQKFLNQFQFSPWQGRRPCCCFCALCLLAFTVWSSRGPFVRWSWWFQLKLLSCMKISTFHTLIIITIISRSSHMLLVHFKCLWNVFEWVLIAQRSQANCRCLLCRIKQMPRRTSTADSKGMACLTSKNLLPIECRRCVLPVQIWQATDMFS